MQNSLVNSWWGFFPLFALFALGALAFLGWGRFLAARLLPKREDTLGRFAEGFVLASLCFFLVPFVLAHFGFLDHLGKAVLYAALAAGLVFFYLERAWAVPAAFAKAHPVFTSVLAFAFLLRALSAFLPQGHGDPLLYHLLGPRLWVQHGGVYFEHDLPNGLLASSWEYLYLWPQLLFFGGRDFGGLMEAQVFSQWIHLTVGWLGTALVLAALLRKGARTIRDVEIGVLAALFVPCMQWTAGLAKNDMGIAFWALASLFLFDGALASSVKRTHGWRLRFALAGVFAGLAIVGKISALFTLAPGVLVLTVLHILRLRRERTPLEFGAVLTGVLAMFVGVLAGALPIYVRNFVLTGNPLFSMPLSMFPTPLISRSWSNHFSVHQLGQVAPTLAIWKSRIFELFREGPGISAMAAALALFLVPLFRRGLGKEEKRWGLAFLATAGLGYAVLASTYGANIELRYLGGGLLLAAGAGFVLLLALLRTRLPERAMHPLTVVLFLVILAFSKLPTHLLWKLQRIHPGEAYVLSHSGGDSREWVRKNVKMDELVIVMADNEAYYLSPLRVAILTERPDTDAATYGETDPASFVKNLCRASGASYLLVTREEFGFAKKFQTTTYEPALVFQGAASKVYDLGKMEQIAGTAPGEGKCRTAL